MKEHLPLVSRGLLILYVCLSPFAAAQGESFEKATTPVPSSYVVQPGDVLEVFVWKEPDISRKVLVRPDGYISFPLLQDLKAAGVTPQELKKAIEQRLGEYVSAPNVTVVVDTIRSYTIFVIGKVQKPGEYLREQPVSVLQALSLAGGFQDYADKGEIRIFRNFANNPLVLQFNYEDVIRGKKPGQNVVLQSGDVVAVP
ncbi:MAG: polysaccharide export protein [Acidobacteria bacterium]|nr:MAG: polysaccharide export protein [Acidobacteriota bacterium]